MEAKSSKFVKMALMPSIYRKLKSVYGFVLLVLIVFTYYTFRHLESDVPFFNLKRSMGRKHSRQACHIPKLDPFNPTVMKLVSNAPEVKPCHAHPHVKYQFLFNSSQHPYPHLVPAKNLEAMKKLGVHTCFYQNLVRGTGNYADSVPSHRDPKRFPVNMDRETKIPTTHEFIVVSCQIVDASKQSDSVMTVTPKIMDMHAFVHEKSPKETTNSLNNTTTTKHTKENGKNLNVIIVGLDSVSRMGFIRSSPKTYKYLMNDLNAVEMTGYNKRGDNTFPNIVPMLTNLPTIEESSVACEKSKFFDTCPFIWKRFEDAAYATLFAEDESTLGILNLNKRGFHDPPTTYYLRPFLMAANGLIGHTKDKLTFGCYGPRLAIQVMLDYMQKMSYVMKHGHQKRNYFMFSWSSSLTHDNINGGKFADESILNSLKWWSEGGYLNDTMLVVMSDHGVRWGELRSYHQGLLEDRLPFMYIVMPSQFKVKHREAFKNLIANQNRLITSVDMYETLVHILRMGNHSAYPQHSTSETPLKELNTGISLFHPIPVNRTCKMAGVVDGYCTCNYQMKSLLVTDKHVINATDYALHTINEKLAEYKKCAFLRLNKILQATQVNFEQKLTETKNWVEYQLTFQTTPGNATFEAFVFWNWKEKQKTWGVSGRIGRTSFYGNQSHCVDKKKIKMYCYCVDLL